MNYLLKPGQTAWGRSPVRLDLAGGWTDTPPYTNRYGGSVVNVAVDLNGQPPVQVYATRTESSVLKIQSIDLDCSEVIESFSQLANYQDPASAFGLAKAALCQLWSRQLEEGVELPAFLRELKGGLTITSFVAIPKGSGLGTSSVLGAAILGTLQKSFGLVAAQDEFVQQVLMLEQMLTTGGGWQDQVGGAIGGVKYSVNHPAEEVKLDIEFLDSRICQEPFAGNFVLYYTGQTRLAKSILADVVSRVQSHDRGYLQLHERIAFLAAQMRSAIARRDLDGVGEVLNESWSCKKQIHPSTTNNEVETLFTSVSPYCRASCLMGAGGGGYALFLAKDLGTSRQLKTFLEANSSTGPARVVEWQFNPEGLQVSLN